MFLGTLNRQLGRSIRGFTKEAAAAIEVHPWPGNVREMENRMKRAVVMAEGSLITPADLELLPQQNDLRLNLRQVRDNAERQALQRALSLFNGNISQAAETLGVSRPTLYDLLSKHGLK